MFRFNRYLTFLVIGLILFFTAGLVDAAAAPVQQSGSDSGFRYEPVGYVSVSNLNVRSGPGTNYSTFAVVHYGQVLYLLGRNESTSWLQVRLGNGQQGWVMRQYVSASPEDIAHLPMRDNPPPPQVPVEAIGYVTVYRLNVRSGPGLNQPIMGYVWRGERVALLGRNSASNWLQIRLPGYSKGWVSAHYIQSSVPIYTLPITEVGIPEPQIYTGIVTSYNLNVRTGPGFNYPIVGRLNEGQQVSIYGRDVSGAWFKIGLPNGAQGWAASRYIQISIPVTQLKVL